MERSWQGFVQGFVLREGPVAGGRLLPKPVSVSAGAHGRRVGPDLRSNDSAMPTRLLHTGGPVTLKRQRRAGAGYRGPHHRDEPGGHAGGPPHSRPCSPLLGVPLLVSHSRRCIKTPTPQAAQWVAPGDGIGGWVRGRHRRDFEVGGEGSVVAALSLRLWPWSEAPESRGMVEGPRGHLS